MGVQISAAAEAGRYVEQVDSDTRFETPTLKRNEQLVYNALCQSQTPLKAYDLLDTLQEHGLRAPMTIYRALEALIAKACVKKIESLNAFVAVDFEQTSHARAFLICRKCMQAKEIALDEEQVAALFAPMDVSVGDVRVEAFGDCHQVCDGG